MKIHWLFSIALTLAASPSSYSSEESDAEAISGDINDIKVHAPMVKAKDKINAGNEASKVIPQSIDPQEKLDKRIEGKPTLALALGGGGARGAAHIGVIRALQKEGISIDCIVGNSMGAIVGGLYAAGVPLEDIEHILEDKSLRKAYIPAPILLRVAASPLVKLTHPFRKHHAGIFTGRKYQEFLEKIIPADKADFENLNIPFYAVATNLVDGKAYTIHSGSLASAIHASSAISPLLEPVDMEDKVYVDGGIRANLPAYAARQSGAAVVCAVLVDEPMLSISPSRFSKMKQIASRMTDIILAVNDEHQLQYADIIINPDVSKIPVISKRPADVRRAIKAGEMSTEKALPALRQILQEKAKH